MTTPVATRLSSAELEQLREQAEQRGYSALAPYIRTMIREALEQESPYQLDRKGNFVPGKYDLSTDVIEWFKRQDVAARDRVLHFVRAQFVSAADVAALNPNVQRGDLFVEQRSFRYPFWSAVEKSPIADQTPFTIPKWSSSSGLVAAHTEGVEPASGTFVVAGQTITPSPVSGKASITREAWDQGGSPQLSEVIWGQMQRGWYEHLEASAVTLLEGLAPTVITLTTGAADTVLADNFDTNVIPLAFVRGGQQMRDLVLQVDLYKALGLAKGSDGHRLYERRPAESGDGSALVVADGLLGRAGWALAPTGVVSANSYLFDRASVSGWATPPLRLTFEEVELRYVHLSIWGYKALACTDVTGVRRISYDPV